MFCGNKCLSDSRCVKFYKNYKHSELNLWKILKNHLVFNTKLRGGQSSSTE